MRIGFLIFLLIFCFSLSSDSCCFLQLEAEGVASGAGPPEGREEGGTVDPWVGEAQVAAPLNREEGERRREGERQKTGAPRPQGPEEMALAPGATPPAGDADLGGAVRPAHD